MRKKQVVVIGSSDQDTYNNEAFLIGEHIAENGWVLITGGRDGVMKAASKGAAGRGGMVIGILPGDSLSGANEYCTAVIPTGMGFARNVINILSADVVVSISGESGTLSELAYSWNYGKPVICCVFSGGWSKRMAEMPEKDRSGSVIYKAESLEEVYHYLNDILSK